MLIRSMQCLKTLRLFQRTDGPLTVWQIIAWWEVRRIPYNVLVGVAGIVTIICCLASAAIGETFLGIPIRWPDLSLFALFQVIVYGVMANICFTGGWMAEIVALKVWKDEADHFGRICFMLGVIFSIALTVLPAVLIMGVLVVYLLIHYISGS